ncbi:ADP-dependent (S)-NAD(P)H-hydrate dehydratase [Candidatus Bilamarchaeum dharawalense]|uniref:ADP-dependent (S)-NAD(P)H-hydrate dehydratase n=1 Tax=Candidatus Bilamarchaeum dharawalense TaxID=2885759 RepID=A0A5E4LMP4_9ARCH|nr:ADP-dependent (S)-NAD(P)H-hydrate dehydratase [Candidatus Bilamarchaeum dharawalense]
MDLDEIKKTIYVPPKESHKGQNGKLLIVGGSKRYHGAPMFSILAARRLVDLLYFYPGEDDSQLINAIKTIPETMIIYDFDIVEKCDCVLFGIGLAGAGIDVDYLIKNSEKLVIDGDGLGLVKEKLCRLKPNSTILTPHEGEFRMLFECEGSRENVEQMADSYGVVILKKDPSGDIISNGKRTFVNTTHNQGMTKGGTGDVLAGLVAALFCKNPSFESAVAGAYFNGLAGERLKKRFGFNFCASDLANELAETMK